MFPEHANQSFIAGVLAHQGIGWVHHVDLIEKNRNGERYFQAFVHFVYWYNTYEAYALQAQVLDPQQTATLNLPEREVRPGVLRPAYWILSECHNPLTPLERELRTQLYDERAQADWELEEMRDLVAQQNSLIQLLLDEALDETPIEEFDPLLNTPEDVSELPIVGAELAASRSEEFMRDFFEESHDAAFSTEWLSLSADEKRIRLDQELAAYFADTKVQE